MPEGAVLPVASVGDRRAEMLRQTKYGSQLARMMKEGPPLRSFTRIAADDGGVDLEGIAVAGILTVSDNG